MSKLPTAVIGFGQVASGYALDAVMARHFPYAAHAQVLADHPGFDWLAVVDPLAEARTRAKDAWRINTVAADVADLSGLANDIEVAVLATPPESRLRLLEHLPSLRAVLVEKPLGRSLADSAAFLSECSARGILVQVNLWRRADRAFRQLADGQLAQLIGAPQCGFGLYGNGLLNNGTHMVDFVRMLLGEILSVRACMPETAFVAGPIVGDTNVGCSLQLANDVIVTLSPLRFAHYRENGIDVWGEHGRVAIYNEGLTIAHYRRAANRAMSGEHEITTDEPQYIRSTAGDALYHMYSNLADALSGTASLFSTGESALRTSAVMEAIVRSAQQDRPIAIAELLEEVVAA